MTEWLKVVALRFTASDWTLSPRGFDPHSVQYSHPV